MQYKTVLRALAIGALVFVWFVAPVFAAPPTQAPDPPGEPNDSFGAATPITAGSAFEAAIFPRGDADWYVLEIDHPGELTTKITGVAPTLDVVLRVWNANKDVVHDWFAPLNKGGDTTGVTDLAEAGRYYLEVRDGADDEGVEQPFTITTAFIPTPDQSEPNNNSGRATPLAFDQPVDATILPQGDADWYAVKVDQHGELRVTIAPMPADLDVVFRVWNENRDVITNWFAPLKQGGSAEGVIDLPAPGRYFLEVRDGADDNRSVEPYTVQAAFTPSADLYEPNGSFGSAAPLEVGAAISATILPQGDADWYVFSVPHHGELALLVNNVAPDLAVFARLWNANREVISDWFRPLAAGGDTAGTFDLPAPGRYYLEVSGDSGQRAIQPYNLRLDFAAAVDSFEPNNDYGHAAELAVDRSAQANILPAGDADWYAFDVPQAGELNLRVTNAAPDLAVFFRIWNRNKDVVSDWFRPLNVGGDTVGIFDAPAPGRYYLEVGGDSGQRSIQPYALQIGYTASEDAYEPNGAFETAAPVTLDTTIVGTILPAGDGDWYQFVAPAGDLYVLVTNVAPDMGIAFRIWDANRNVLSDWTASPEPGQDATVAISLTQPLTYYVELGATEGKARSAQPYLLYLSMAPIDPALVTLPGAAPTATTPPTPTSPTTPPVSPDESKTVTVPVTTGKVTILTSGQVGPLGLDLFVSDKAGLDGARLQAPAGALDALTTIDIGVTPDRPENAPFGLQPAGVYWVFTPSGLAFKQPVTITLPVPAGAAAPEMFIGHWNGNEWVDLGGTVKDGLITAVTDSFSDFGVFCGRLADYTALAFENASSSPYVELRYLTGPSPDPENPEGYIAGCPLPYDVATVWTLKQGEQAHMLLRPGVYGFTVSYPQPQPGVANNLFITIPPGGGEQTVRITDEGATSDNAATKINFAGREVTQGSNVRPIIACNATVPDGVALTNGDPAATVLPSRVVLASQLKLEQMPPKGPGVEFTAVGTDPEGSQLRTFWTLAGGAGAATQAGDPVASGATIADQYTFQPSVGGDYTVFLTIYDDLGLFDECRWVLNVVPNARPAIKVFTGRTTVEFGRLDEERSDGVGSILPATTAMRPGAAAPLVVPATMAGAAPVAWDGLTLCPTAAAGPFAALPDDLNAIVTTPAPVDVLLPPAGDDTTNRWAYPGRTCVWALVADADGDPLTTAWELPEPLYGAGNFYAAVNVPAGFSAAVPDGIAQGALLATYPQMEAYNAWVSALANLAGVVPAVVWEAWDDPCPPGSGDVANPCPSGISRGGVENMVATTTDGFALPPRSGYAPVAVLPEAVDTGECANVFFIASLTPSPSDPGPDEDVRVTARVAPLTEGCVMDMSIVGTDNYQNQAFIPTNKSGEAELFIPGGADGVVDVVTARFCSPLPEGTPPPAEGACQTPAGNAGRWIEMQVTYTF